jgi:hypothetical protein
MGFKRSHQKANANNIIRSLAGAGIGRSGDGAGDHEAGLGLGLVHC